MDMSNSSTNTQMVDRIKTTSMENVSTGVLEKNIEHYLRSKDKAEKWYDVSRYIQLRMSKYKKDIKKIYSIYNIIKLQNRFSEHQRG